MADLWNYRVRTLPPAVPAEFVSLAPGAVSNSASGNALVAPGSLISVRGDNFSSRTYTASTTPLPKTLGGTTVSVGGQAIPLLVVSPGQIVAQLPAGTPGGNSSLKVIRAGQDSDAVQFFVEAIAPGLFTWTNGRGIIAGIPEDPGADLQRGLVLNRDFSFNSPGNPAARGDVIVIYGTGQGPVEPPVADGAVAPAFPLSNTPVDPEVTIGGLPGAVRLSCLVPDLIGLWQIDVEVPAEAPTGDSVPVRVKMAGAESNTVLISVR